MNPWRTLFDLLSKSLSNLSEAVMVERRCREEATDCKSMLVLKSVFVIWWSFGVATYWEEATLIAESLKRILSSTSSLSVITRSKFKYVS